jgi:hypothetical protein
MISRKGQGFYFTVQDLAEETGVEANIVRSKVARLTDRGVFIRHDKLRPTNQNIYRSPIDPLVAIGQRDEEVHVPAVSGFFNNPFRLKNATDWRNRYEELFN